MTETLYIDVKVSQSRVFGLDAPILSSESVHHLYAKDIYNRTSLSFAAGNGHVAMVWPLLYRGVEVDSEDSDGWTPLW
jgi:ankyrin repeat protein